MKADRSPKFSLHYQKKYCHQGNEFEKGDDDMILYLSVTQNRSHPTNETEKAEKEKQ